MSYYMSYYSVSLWAYVLILSYQQEDCKQRWLGVSVLERKLHQCPCEILLYDSDIIGYVIMSV